MAAESKQEFVPHMSSEEAAELKVDDAIDYRLSTGQFTSCTIVEKVGSNLKIFCNGWNAWCDYTQELYRLAKHESISKRPAHKFQEIKKGDFVDINPVHRHPGWRPAEIKQRASGQIQVMYDLHTTHNVY